MNLSLSFCSDEDDVPAAAATHSDASGDGGGGGGGGGLRRLGLSLGAGDSMEDDPAALAPMITIGESAPSEDQAGSFNVEGKFSSKKAKVQQQQQHKARNRCDGHPALQQSGGTITDGRCCCLSLCLDRLLQPRLHRDHRLPVRRRL